MKNPEQQARQTIDAALEDCGWVVQDYEQMNLAAGQGIAVREFPLASGFGRADYALYVGEELVGAVEAKKAGVSFAGAQFFLDVLRRCGVEIEKRMEQSPT